TPQLLSSFFVSYIFILIPFFIINGILTGSFILDEIVWYNDNYNLGIRIGTIPFEDIFYGFSLLFLPLYINQELKSIDK
ncbi:MAG: lycopene cyclase domain-containing protein, partial [Candidatus Neomarinimicrobiota bacterium]|nr:lycopene cyclase domain-containing protein [Candidatus Neomarinimicrobiota bacterium]